MSQTVAITRSFTFDAAHYLPDYSGPCGKLHGHTYKLEVTVSRPLSSAEDFMVMDFGDLKTLVQGTILNSHDHANLNTLYEMPTAEVMVALMFAQLSFAIRHSYSSKNVTLDSVKLWETGSCYAECRG